jgi:hypothetical protein
MKEDFINIAFSEVKLLFDDLGFKNKFVLDIAYKLIEESFNQNINLMIGSSPEQIILYTENKPDCFSNIAIDEDGDISYMYFDKEPNLSKRTMYYFDQGLDYENLLSLLK